MPTGHGNAGGADLRAHRQPVMARAALVHDAGRGGVDQGRYCIVNVDDFGLSNGVNRGIVEAHRAGIITSASLMVNCRASEAAAALACDHPRLSVGLHVNMTNEGDRPIIDLDDVTAANDELWRQAEAFHELMGKPPTHLDSHHHVHRRRALTAMFHELAVQLGVPLRDHSGVRFCGTFYAQWDDETHPEQVTVESLTKMLVGFGA